jgi:hypothetical protein
MFEKKISVFVQKMNKNEMYFLKASDNWNIFINYHRGLFGKFVNSFYTIFPRKSQIIFYMISEPTPVS